MAGRCDQNDSRSWSCRQPMDCWVVGHQVKINFQKAAPIEIGWTVDLEN